MAWTVETYCEETDDQPVPVVENEALAFLDDAETRFDAAKLVGWLHAVAKGMVPPQREPESGIGGWTCRYRTDGQIVVIFCEVGPARLLVVRFARAASTFPTTGDLNLAARRMRLWSERYG